MSRYDAVVVGAGVNGLGAAVVMAQAGRSVLVLEAQDVIGGAAQTLELTLPGFLHDPFSAIHPLGIGSPFLRALPLGEHGLEWIHPDAPLAHPLDDGSAGVLERSVGGTGRTLGPDAAAWARLMAPFVGRWDDLAMEVLRPLVHLPAHPLLLARFGIRALPSVRRLSKLIFRGPHAPALLAGIAAHSGLPLDFAGTAAFGMVLGIAGHAVGWPFPRGGARKIPEAIASYLRSLGGEIVTGVRVRTLDEIPPARAVFLDVTPQQLLRMAGDRLPALYRWGLRRYRYGVGVCKVDWALSEPIPWRAEGCGRAGTVHLGGGFDEVADGETLAWRGELPPRPFVLLAQHSLFDSTRAPAGKHTAWAYTHVPHGCDVDMTERIETEIERFAPGFRDVILARHVMSPSELERRDANLVGGDVNGGAATLQQFIFRPMPKLNPYATPLPGVYLCSASTPPGGGVHGMCGFWAAKAALRDGL